MVKILIIIGSICILLALLFHIAPSVFSWFGKLPGDIRIEKENTRIFIPITSMLLISALLTLILNIGKIFRLFK